MSFRENQPALFQGDLTFRKDVGIGINPNRDPMTAPAFSKLGGDAPGLEPGAELCSRDIVLRKG